jgi:hypothetical protein
MKLNVEAEDHYCWAEIEVERSRMANNQDIGNS